MMIIEENGKVLVWSVMLYGYELWIMETGLRFLKCSYKKIEERVDGVMG